MVPKSPSKPRPTSSACGRFRSSRSVTSARHKSSSSSTRSTRKRSRRTTRSSPETPFTTRSGIASTRWPAGLARQPRDISRCPSSHGRSVSRSPRAGPSLHKVSLEPRSSKHSASSDMKAWETPSSRGVLCLATAEALLELGRSSRRRRRSCHRLLPGSDLKTSFTTPRHALGSRSRSSGTRKRQSMAGERRATTRLLRIRGTVVHAVEGLLAGGMLDEAEAVIRRAKRAQVDLGQPGLDFADGRILLAVGRAAEARPFLEHALASFEGSRPPALGLAPERSRGERPLDPAMRTQRVPARVVHPERPPCGRGSGSRRRPGGSRALRSRGAASRGGGGRRGRHAGCPHNR